MPQINLNDNSSNTPTPVKDNSQQAPPMDPMGFGAGGASPWDSWGGGGGWGAPQNQQSGGKKMTPQERVSMIEKVYEEVLGRKADTRDINYYKYSTLSEEEIRKQLIAGKEHKQLVEDGREYKKMKDRAMQAETRVKMLESQNNDQIEEFKHLSTLLKEKNNYIQKLREQLKNPYNNIAKPVESVTSHYSSPATAPRPDSAHQSFSTINSPQKSSEKQPSGIKKVLRDILSI